MTIIGLDCATKTGWATVRGGRVCESGVQTFALARGESAGMRFLRFRRWLPALVSPFEGQVVIAYEQAHHRGGAATDLCVGMTTRVQEWAAERGYECMSVHSGALKKWATGSGSASKFQMIDAAMGKAQDQACADDNQADAILLALYGWEAVKEGA